MTKTLNNALIAGQSTTRILGGAYSSLHFQTPSSSSSSRFFPAEPLNPLPPFSALLFLPPIHNTSRKVQKQNRPR